MARFFKVEELESRKRALIAESDVYRRVLSLELHNLQVYGQNVKGRFSLFKRLEPVLEIAAAMAGLVRSRPLRRSRRTLLSKLLRGWRIYKMLAPVLDIFLRRRSRASRVVEAGPEF